MARFFKDYFTAGTRFAGKKYYSRAKVICFSILTIAIFVGAISLCLGVFTIKIINAGSKENDFYSSAGSVCSDIISEYGSCKIEKSSENDYEYQLTGISFVRRIDFDNDGQEELVVSYNRGNNCFIEVWGFYDNEFVTFYKDEVNSIPSHSELGKWITIYTHNGKSYLGVFIGEDYSKMDIMALSKNGFKSVFTCEFDPDGPFYIIDDKINASEFETIKLTNLTSIKAEYYQNQVNNNLSDFISLNTSYDSSGQTDEQMQARAFYKIIESKLEKYGEPQVLSTGDGFLADGVAIAELIDFNGDGCDEMLVISRNKNHFDDTPSSPKYVTEVFSWTKGTVKKVFDSELTTAYFDPDGLKRDVFYILQRADGKVNICSNTYSYGENPQRTWKGVSRISEMTSAEGFETTYTVSINKNYDYYSYKINGNTVYYYEYSTKGHKVPLFCNDDKYNANEFEIKMLKSDSVGEEYFNNMIASTQNTIKKLNSGSLY